MFLNHKVLLVLFTVSVLQCDASLKTVDDDKLMNLIKSETYVIVLFASKDCEKCGQYENSLVNAKEELSKSFDATIVKTINSQLTRLYSPGKEPVLVFFRHGIPLLYNGLPNDELIIHTFLNNKEPVVRELTDETFEHLTQASSGATTGDWFVMFYTPECVDCHRLQARWEAVGAHLKSRMNIARVNKALDGAATAKRFDVTQIPSFILFRQGKLYRYQIQKYDTESFIAFAQDWYKNMKPERVPSPKTPFDLFVDKIVQGLQENPWLWKISFFTSLIGFMLAILVKYRRQSIAQPKVPSKKEKEEKDK